MTAAVLQIARSVSLFLAAVLVIAAVHKLTLVRMNRAEEEPLLTVSPWRERHARSLLLGAAGAEAGFVVGLVMWPVVGSLCVAILFASYLRELRHLRTDASCNCLGRFLNLPVRRLELRRNAVLLGLSSSVAAIGLFVAPLVPVSQMNIGLGVVEFALFVSFVRVAALRGRSGLVSDDPPRSSELGVSVPPTEVVYRRSMPA